MFRYYYPKSGIFYRFGNLVWLKEFERGEVIELLEGMKLDFTTIDTIINTFNCHPYYTSRIIKDIMLQPIYGTSVENLENYINQVLIPEENAYLELQTEKIKARSNALDIFTNIALGIDPYSLGLSKQVVYNTLRNLEVSGFIRKLDKSKYMVTDPLLKLYFNQIYFAWIKCPRDPVEYYAVCNYINVDKAEKQLTLNLATVSKNCLALET